MAEEREKEGNLSNNVKFMITTLVVIAILQLGVLGFIFKDELAEVVSGITAQSTEVLIYPLESVQVNLDQGNYLKTTINVSYTNKKHTDLIDQSIVKVQAFVIEILRSKSLDQINTVDKTKILGEEIKEGINDILDSDVVSDIYFIEFIYQ